MPLENCYIQAFHIVGRGFNQENFTKSVLCNINFILTMLHLKLQFDIAQKASRFFFFLYRFLLTHKVFIIIVIGIVYYSHSISLVVPR